MMLGGARNAAIALLLALVPAVSLAAPSIFFENEVHDFGDVPQGKEAEYSFPFENRGSSELVIEKVSSS